MASPKGVPTGSKLRQKGVKYSSRGVIFDLGSSLGIILDKFEVKVIDEFLKGRIALNHPG